MSPKIEEPKDVLYLDGIYLSRKSCILICCDKDYVLGWYLCRYEHSGAWEALMSRIVEPKVVVSDGGTGFRKALKRKWPKAKHGVYGLAESFIRCKEKGYTRSFASMCRQVRKKGYRKPTIHKKSYCKYKHMEGKYPGDKFQIDIKYVPSECIKFPSYGNRYYQITGIDEYSRKRVLK